MFFRRMFARKDNHNGDDDDDDEDNENVGNVDYIQASNNGVRGINDKNNNSNSSNDYEMQRNYTDYRKYATATAPNATTSTTATKHCSSATSLHRAATAGSSVVQLTPLWEHILRTRTLPSTICPVKMFAEFHERLRDPEWQVRQHALRVLVDVLVVMRSKADAYMEPLIAQLVENLGHPAPTVRKGALDCLRVYLAETAMPETILLQVLDIGLNQKITNEPFGGRLTCGVMLSLPALIQSTLHTPKRHFILRTTVDMLVQKMGQVSNQEITLKVLAKIRELIGEREFVELMSHGAYREFELLCNVYGVGDKCASASKKKHLITSETPGGSWRLISQQSSSTSQNGWRSSSAKEAEQLLDCAPTQGKVIMETEIKINDDTLTMRILEAKDDDCCTETETEVSPHKPHETQDTYPNSLEDDVVCGRLLSAKSLHDTGGVVQLLSDSEVEEITTERGVKSNAEYYTIVTPSTPSRTPKRVTFGGEVVKMRTPDSDAASSTTININNPSLDMHNQSALVLDVSSNVDSDALSTTPTSPSIPESKTSVLSLEIPNDNTKPLPTRPRTAQSPKREPKQQPTLVEHNSPVTPTSSATISPHSPTKRVDSNASLSPKSPFKRLNISPVDSIVSPKAPHKQIEVLHNLQRDPSPVRALSARRASIHVSEAVASDGVITQKTVVTNEAGVKQKSETQEEKPPPPKSWEELDIVDYGTLMDLRSGDWRHRLQGIAQLAEALRDSENLALVQPCLESLLRTLLSSERNPEVAEDKRRLLMNLISRLPLDNLEDRTVQIMTGLCRQGGAGANRVCKALMQRLPPAVIVLKLISEEFLHAKSSRFREHALQMVMYALMTFPSTCFDTPTCVTSATYAALNRKRRVRQAALDVLAILGQVATPRAVLDVVQDIAATRRDDGAALVAAVKTRLARKQLPLVTADGSVQYMLRMPSPQQQQQSSAENDGQLDPDIDWITAGVGSVSPTSMKRRAHRNRSLSQQSFCCLPQQNIVGCVGGKASAGSSNLSDDSTLRRHSFRSPLEVYSNEKDTSGYHQIGNNEDNHPYHLQHMLGNSVPMHFGIASKKSNDYTNFLSRRMVAKSCSDSSMDGRSSDSTYTSSSGGGGGGAAVAASCVAATDADASGISGRFTRQTVNSRFPAMDRMDLNATYVRVHKPPTYYPGMGAYAHLQQQQYNMSSTYPKINYNMSQHHQNHGRRKSHQQQHQQQQQQQQQQYQQQQHLPLHYANNHSNSNLHHNQQQQQYQHQQYQQQQEEQHQQQQHQYHQQHFHQKSNSSAQENFMKSENPAKEQNNLNNGNLDGTYTICSGTPVSNNTTTTTTTSTTKASQQQQQQQQQQQHQIANIGNTVRRFINVEKFIMQSNKSSQTNGATPTEPVALEPKQQTTPINSVKSLAYSQKSTASAHSSSGSELRQAVNLRSGTPVDHNNTIEVTTPGSVDQNDFSTPTTTLVGTLNGGADNDNEVGSESPTKWTSGDDEEEEMLQIENILEEAATETAKAILAVEEQMGADVDGKEEVDHEETLEEVGSLKRNGSLASLQSKTESIQTQIEDSPPAALSRAQSIKSLVIEEDLNDNNDSSFVVVQNEYSQPAISAPLVLNSPMGSPVKKIPFDDFVSQMSTPKSRPPSRMRSPTIAELKTLSRRNSMIKSMESLYERPSSKQDSLDNTMTTTNTTTTTEETSSQSSNSQLNATLPIKAPQHTPLKQKSKTSHFLKQSSRCRISPVKKQSIKMSQAELYPPTLQGFEKPREALLRTFDQLDSSNWEVVMLGLKSMVRLLRYHPEQLDNQMHMVCIQLTRSVRNLRSQVARAACQAATELFALKSKSLEQECDDLVCALLHRTADTNRFIRADAARALESMCDCLTPAKVLNILTSKGAQHQNALVRTTAAKLLHRLVERLGSERVFNMPRDSRDKFFITGANLLLEGSLETRSYAKSLFRLLSEHQNYNRLLLEVIPARTYRNVEKTLKSIR